jgi:hypothetical protein
VSARRDTILATVRDLVGELLYYGRKEDEDLPVGAIEEAINAGEISDQELYDQFRVEMVSRLRPSCAKAPKRKRP